VLAFITVHVDFLFSNEQLKTVSPDLLVKNSKLTTTLLSTLAQSILTLTTITFSSIMIVLTTFSGQFSPRTLQTFIADRASQRVLAVFTAGFVYNAVTLLLTGQSNSKSLLITPMFSVISGICCAAFFIYFIHHVAKWVQVNHLIDNITKKTLTTVDNVGNEAAHFNSKTKSSIDAKNKARHVIPAKSAGYIELINFRALLKIARACDITIEMQVHIGDYVLAGTTIAAYSGNEPLDDQNQDKIRTAVKLATERTSEQDIEFGIQQLVEIALRAISPAVNDPHTAINCINRIGTIISHLSQTAMPGPYIYDPDGNHRLTISTRDMEHFLYKGLYQIRHYGKGDISVTVGMLRAIKRLAETTDTNTRKLLADFVKYVREGFDDEVLQEKDRMYLQKETEDVLRLLKGGLL
ncbi:MAG TPA: DUF2254 domain-containing protein, partial [Bacillales bacterium]|nr:DUF2254 domain-containing protein [Bacillales bacterium]